MKYFLWATIFAVVAHVQLIEGNAACKDRVTWCNMHKSLCNTFTNMQKDCRKTCNFCSVDCDPEQMGCEFGCSHTASGPVCTCPNGTTLHANQKSCVDIDECLGDNPCPADRPTCINNVGSFFCKEVPLCNSRPGLTYYYNKTSCCAMSQDTCGQNSASEGLNGVGADAILALWPWTAFVFKPSSYCAGVLIANSWVVVSAHCVSAGNETTTQVTLGMRSSTERSAHTIDVGVTSIVVHPAYEYPSNDVALIQLAQPVSFNKYIRPICLPGGELPEMGASCYLSGYETEFYKGGLRRGMQESGMNIVDNSRCRIKLKSVSRSINEHFLCAKHDRFAVSSCPGESGGPLVCQRCNSCDWFLAGVSSYGGACPDSEPLGLFTSIESYENWIVAVTNLNSSNNYACRDAGTVWRPWGAWGACDRTCGTGAQRRSRECNRGNPGSSVGCVGLPDDVKPCNLRTCPRWSRFSQWTSCTERCGGGKQTRQRFCLHGLQGEGGCVGAAKLSRTCNDQPCEWSRWGNWGACSATCGSEATRTRSRKCPSGEGNCPGSATSTKSCNYAMCSGEWTEWSEWSRCSKTCGGGIRVRGRSCENGNRCPGTNLNTEVCSADPCPAPCSNVTNSVGGSAVCTQDPDLCQKFPEFMGRVCGKACCRFGPIEGYSEWSQWSGCSQTCGGGVIMKTRTCDNPDLCYDTIPTRLTKACTPVPCNRLTRNYSTWGTCSATCGGGERRRQVALCNGNDECTISFETESCETDECPAEWTTWEPWGECSASCGAAMRQRMRSCTNGSVESSDCAGEGSERESCNNEPCEGVWSTWSGWNNCNATCGEGWQSRMRHCTTGLDCIGEAIEQRTCNAGACSDVVCENSPGYDTACTYLKSLCHLETTVKLCRKTCGEC